VSGPPKRIEWAAEAQDQLRAIELTTARRILQAIDDFVTDGTGEVKKLRPPRNDLRLRVGDYRVFFYQTAPTAIKIIGVKHRSQAYR